ncbi:hypothetical protein FDP41_004863 [Naegleria fowleri]|uniref:Uncharacterized protein n=1 Tax=Naegleria fowleri TaxID=5763 RepID=A0A6A5BPQ5_NAEFO|nr:uncharacterized protein FDP41_004861 [Naegleria fowleri]XP_044560901.1 uncharacterized protein FDP41_004863 [Naegleria fowleri]KAF0976186.1 hypothetical protein FDP41_004861 [Naegleria fowleri]KAF0976188.1 hypothetical protein FDP41_004863 [Naegleria fowleri]
MYPHPIATPATKRKVTETDKIMEAIDNTDQQADTSVVDSKNARTIKEYKKKYELYEKDVRFWPRINGSTIYRSRIGKDTLSKDMKSFLLENKHCLPSDVQYEIDKKGTLENSKIGIDRYTGHFYQKNLNNNFSKLQRNHSIRY